MNETQLQILIPPQPEHQTFDGNLKQDAGARRLLK